jgi:hypothetical protein
MASLIPSGARSTKFNFRSLGGGIMMRVFVVLILFSVTTLSGCASHGLNGLGIGAGLGAIAGQAIGRNTEATLIGAGVGTLFGYITGNEVDKFNQNYQVIPRQQYQPQGYYYPQQQQAPQQYWVPR